MGIVLHFGHTLLTLFNRDPEVIALGYSLSLFVTAVLMLGTLIVCCPTTRMKKQEKKEISA